MNNKIQNICAATGWFARYKIEGKIYLTPIACWVLTKSGKIEGMLLDGKKHKFAARDKFFMEYLHESSFDEN